MRGALASVGGPGRRRRRRRTLRALQLVASRLQRRSQAASGAPNTQASGERTQNKQHKIRFETHSRRLLNQCN